MMNRVPMELPQSNTFAITREELLPGDILIVTDTRRRTNAFNQLTRVTQSAQGLLFAKGHSEAVHAQIIARDDNGDLKIIEVSDDGVLINDIEESYKYNLFVYRPENRILAERAGQVAYAGYKEYRQVKETSHLTEKHETAEEQARKEITYSDAGLVHAIAFPKLIFPYHFTSTHFTLKTFCSKFVIQCFQIAQHQLIEENPQMKHVIHRLFKKEKTSSVKSLEDFLRKHKDFTQHIIPKGKERIYPTLIKDFLASEIVRQQQSPKTAESANAAWEIYQQLTSYVEQNDLLQDKRFKSFDISLAILFLVLGHLPKHMKINKQAYEYGFEKRMMNDKRIMALAYTLLEGAKQFENDAIANEMSP